MKTIKHLLVGIICTYSINNIVLADVNKQLENIQSMDEKSLLSLNMQRKISCRIISRLNDRMDTSNDNSITLSTIINAFRFPSLTGKSFSIPVNTPIKINGNITSERKSIRISYQNNTVTKNAYVDSKTLKKALSNLSSSQICIE